MKYNLLFQKSEIFLDLGMIYSLIQHRNIWPALTKKGTSQSDLCLILESIYHIYSTTQPILSEKQVLIDIQLHYNVHYNNSMSLTN